MKKLVFLLSICLFISCKDDDDDITPVPEPEAATHLYWANFADMAVGKVTLSSLGTSVNYGTTTFPFYKMAMDPRNGTIYGSAEDDNIIYRITSSGTVTTLYDAADGVIDPASIVVDTENNMLIWNNGDERIVRAALDGSGTVTAMYGGATVADYSYGMAIDFENNKLYFSEFDEGILVGNLDGTGTPIQLFDPDDAIGDGLGAPSSIVLDTDNMLVYWADEADDAIAYGNMSGSGSIVKLYDAGDGIDRADGLAIDFVTKKIYWSETNTNRIRRADLYGTGNIENVLTGSAAYETYSLILRSE